jgi:hypothetical protein
MAATRANQPPRRNPRRGNRKTNRDLGQPRAYATNSAPHALHHDDGIDVRHIRKHPGESSGLLRHFARDFARDLSCTSGGSARLRPLGAGLGRGRLAAGFDRRRSGARLRWLRPRLGRSGFRAAGGRAYLRTTCRCCSGSANRGGFTRRLGRFLARRFLGSPSAVRFLFRYGHLILSLEYR